MGLLLPRRYSYCDEAQRKPLEISRGSPGSRMLARFRNDVSVCDQPDRRALVDTIWKVRESARPLRSNVLALRLRWLGTRRACAGTGALA